MSTETLFNRLLQQLSGQQGPPVEQWQPTVNGHIAIRIDANGHWFHEDERIRRPEIVRLFSTILRRDPDGYVLVTPAERLLIEVDDVPFMAVDFEIRHHGDPDLAATDLIFTTNVQDLVFVDREHPLWMSSTDQPRPYLRVRPGLDARITRAAYYRLVEHAIEDDGRIYVASGGMRFLLGAAA